LDLIIGEKSGNVNYYKNIGTAQSPQWSLVTETLAGAEASSYLGLDGFSVPFVLKDNQGIWNLYLGNEMGTINHYQFEAGTVGLGTLVDSAFQDIREGDRSSSGWADFTGDGTLDMVMGHSGGGIALFTGDDVVIGQSEQAKPDLMLYPNPGTDGLTIAGQNGECDIKIFNALGQCLAHYQKQILPFYVTTSSWSKGMYWIRMQNDSGVATKQWMKN
jgi:hypothetical protein